MALTSPELQALEEQVPRDIARTVTRGDRIFRTLCASAAAVSLFIIGGTALFLAIKAVPALQKAGLLSFFTTSVWNPTVGDFGVLGLLIGTIIIATVSLIVAVPLAIGLALFINEYSPARIRRILTSSVDLLAAMPSIIFGMWGFFALQAPLVGVASWLNLHLSAIPFFRLSEPDAPLLRSSFIVGTVVALMIVPIITSVSDGAMPAITMRSSIGSGWVALGNDQRSVASLWESRNHGCRPAGVWAGTGRNHRRCTHHCVHH